MTTKRTTRPTITSLERAKKTAILAALKLLRGEVELAAERLEIGKTTLYRKLKEYGVRFKKRRRPRGSKQNP